MLSLSMEHALLGTESPTFRRLFAAGKQFNHDRVRSAIALAEQLYRGLTHRSGVAILQHVQDVLEVLLPFEPDEDAVIACILHHILESKKITLMDLEEQFGQRVRTLVSGVHLLSHVTLEDRRASIDDLRLILLSVSDDIRIVLIILCDRCCSVELINQFPLTERRAVCRDVLNLFAPVAARLGIHSLKQRMETHAFPVIYPDDAERIREQLNEVHRKYGDFLGGAAEALERVLQEQGIRASVSGREKHPYSIFSKMRAQALTHVDRIYDLFALRVVVSSMDECYQALGILHRLGRPALNRFKDYIAFPKPNGYQSLHTTLVKLPAVPDPVFVEVQIRTAAMHREAEFGVAAHWSYKEGGTAEQAAHRVQLQHVLASQHALGGEEVASAYVDHIFVLTPKGDIVELPEGATPLDFAFQIHTNLGLSFRAARVNGDIVSLDHVLENGDVIEILKHKTPKPSPEWMQLLKVASSRTRLKRYLYSLHRDLYLARGRKFINEELARRTLPPLDTELTAFKVVAGTTLTASEREDIVIKIGQGSEKAASLFPKLPVSQRGVLRPTQARPRPRQQRKDAIIEVEGGVQMPMRFAKCCKPEATEGKPIVGFVTRTGDVTIHLQKCHLQKNANPERQVKVRWR